MWLLPVFSTVGRLAAHVYYRLSFAGTPIPPTGPTLLVANHPNSLFDPVLVIAAARRQVRFLAKAPLFTDAKVGWIVRASGSIPVYRRSDDPSQISRNEEMFRAVHEALTSEAAVAIFPEGTSHSEPGLARLKTGAARIALGYSADGHSFPIVPVGLVLRAKDTFRSEALVIVGEAVSWDDLADRTPADEEAVRDLTARIERGIRDVTINLDRWEDEPVVRCALGVWEASRAEDSSPHDRVRRLEVTTSVLRSVREGGVSEHEQLVEAVRVHDARLERLQLRPSDLVRDTQAVAALRWSARRIALLSLPAVAAAVVGHLLFWVPFMITGRVSLALRPAQDQRATYKLLVGIPVYTLWIAALTLASGLAWGPWAAVLALVGSPVVGMTGLLVRERWRGAWADARSFVFLRSRRALVEELRHRQAELAARLDGIYRRYRDAEEPQ